MGRPRAFDYDVARRLRKQGLTYRQIGDRLGVSGNAANRACNPAFNRRQQAKSKEAIEALRHPCFGGCGVLVWGHLTRSSGYCLKCYAERFWRHEVHGTESGQCAGCRCEACRLAANEAKRLRRERSRVPCSHGCGTLVDSINRRDPSKPPECRPCSRRRIVAERCADNLADTSVSGAPAGLREQAVEGDSLPVVPLAADEAAA